jgi:2-polyprenyl-3-methyl-5-hydroxy-6-metoxy-1,4-benzoquinol methylase
MQINTTKYEYSYQNSEPAHHHAYLLKPLLELLTKAARTNNNQLRVLDLGCGNGSLSSIIAQHGYQVVGIESSESGIQFARQKFANCEFIHGSVYDRVPQHLEHSFDIVISAEVIEHLYYPKELIKYAKKCLKSDGKFIITTPYHGYWKNLLLAIFGKMDNHYSSLWDDGHIKFFSVNTLTNLLETQGLTI